MSERETREQLVKYLAALETRGTTISQFCADKDIPKPSAVAAMNYLCGVGYVKVDKQDMMMARTKDYRIYPTDMCEHYLSTADETKVMLSTNQFNISGGQNFVANESTIMGGTVTFSGDMSAVPEEFKEELSALIKVIQEASCPKPEQAGRVQAFLEKVATGASAGMLGTCATLLFKAALGLSV